MSDTDEIHSIILDIDNRTELENRQSALDDANKIITKSNKTLRNEISILKIKMNELNNMCQDDDDVLFLGNHNQHISQQTIDNLNSQNKSLLEENTTLKSQNKLLQKELVQRMEEVEELNELENEYNSVINDLENQIISLNNSLDIKSSKNVSKCSFNVNALNAPKSVSSTMLKLKIHRALDMIENKDYLIDDGDRKVMDDENNELCSNKEQQRLQYEAKEWIWRKNTEDMEIQNKMLNEELNDIKEQMNEERLEYQLKIRHLIILSMVGLIVMIAMITMILMMPIIEALLSDKLGNNEYFLVKTTLDNDINFNVLSIGSFFILVQATLIFCVRYKTRLKQRFYSS